MSSYQADWLLDDEGKEINEEDEEEEGGSEEDGSEEEGDMEQQQPEDQRLSMPPPIGLPKRFNADAASEFGDDGDDITLDGSILTANMPSKKELQVTLPLLPLPPPDPLPKAKRALDAEGDDRFPDEVDTPDDVAARVRFARYRALLSFRTSPWHPKENLPQDYSRIYQFESFTSTQKWSSLLPPFPPSPSVPSSRLISVSAISRCRSLQSRQDRLLQESVSRPSTRSRVNSSLTSLSEDGACETMVDANDDGATLATAATASTLPGTNGDYLSTGHYVTMEISHLPLSALHQRIHDMEASGFLSLFSLLQHEYKLSLLHFTLQRSGDTERVIRSKDQLIFEVLSPLSCHLSSLPPSLSLSASLSHMSPL
jgi:hypothetical protein